MGICGTKNKGVKSAIVSYNREDMEEMIELLPRAEIFDENDKLVYYGEVYCTPDFTMRHGKGESYYENGSLEYKGEWINNKKHGIGELFLNGKRRYIGIFKNNKMNTFGNLYNEDGTMYIGQIKEGINNGFGILYSQKNKKNIIKKGYWENGEFVRNDE